MNDAMITRAAVAGWGVSVPEARLTNADLERLVDTTDDWIVERTGIRERRIAQEGETTATLGIAAGAAALKQAGMGPDEVDLLVGDAGKARASLGWSQKVSFKELVEMMVDADLEALRRQTPWP